MGRLAAVGLVTTGDDGRVVLSDAWDDDLTGICEVSAIRARRVDVREVESFAKVETGAVDIGKRSATELARRRAGALCLALRPELGSRPSEVGAICELTAVQTQKEQP